MRQLLPIALFVAIAVTFVLAGPASALGGSQPDSGDVRRTPSAPQFSPDKRVLKIFKKASVRMSAQARAIRNQTNPGAEELVGYLADEKKVEAIAKAMRGTAQKAITDLKRASLGSDLSNERKAGRRVALVVFKDVKKYAKLWENIGEHTDRFVRFGDYGQWFSIQSIVHKWIRDADKLAKKIKRTWLLANRIFNTPIGAKKIKQAVQLKTPPKNLPLCVDPQTVGQNRVLQGGCPLSGDFEPGSGRFLGSWNVRFKNDGAPRNPNDDFDMDGAGIITFDPETELNARLLIPNAVGALFSECEQRNYSELYTGRYNYVGTSGTVVLCARANDAMGRWLDAGGGTGSFWITYHPPSETCRVGSAVGHECWLGTFRGDPQHGPTFEWKGQRLP